MMNNRANGNPIIATKFHKDSYCKAGSALALVAPNAAAVGDGWKEGMSGHTHPCSHLGEMDGTRLLLGEGGLAPSSISCLTK